VTTTAGTDKRATLVREAAVLFRRRGYHGTSMSDIAEAMRLNKGTLYHYFPSKSDILYAIYLEATTRLDQEVAEVPGGLGPQEELVGNVRAILRTTSALPDFIAVYFQEHAWLESSVSAEQATAIREREARFTEQVQGIVERGMREGVFRRVNSRLLVVQLLAMISSLHRWHLTEDLASAELMADTIIGYLYDGILSHR
jgi:AcrR family transcriptional regulator